MTVLYGAFLYVIGGGPPPSAEDEAPPPPPSQHTWAIHTRTLAVTFPAAADTAPKLIDVRYCFVETWTAHNPVPNVAVQSARWGCAAAALTDHKILLLGCTEDPQRQRASESITLFDVGTLA